MRVIFIYFLVILVLAVRIYFYYNTERAYKDGDTIRISTIVRGEPIRYDTSQYIRVEGLKIYLPLYPEISYGDKITVEGTAHGDKLKNPKLISVNESTNSLYNFRKSLINFYKESLPEPHASLVAGVTIGAKSGIPQDFWETLKNSGTAHVVVASGMNVSLIGGFLIAFLTIFLKRRRALLFALVGVWIYAVLCGFDAPIVRAAIMGSIAFIAQEIGRLNLSLRALLLSASIMLFVKPSYLKDLGFWLSVLATLGIILLEPRISKFLRRLRTFQRPGFVIQTLVADLSTTLAAQVGVAPVIYYFFGKFNILSPLVNVLVLWTIVPITLIGIVGGFVGLVYKPIGTIIMWLSYPFSAWFVKVVNVFG